VAIQCWKSDVRHRCESLQTIQAMGFAAALNMQGKNVPMRQHAPFRSILLLDNPKTEIKIVGNIRGKTDEVYIDKDGKNDDFIAYYIRDDKILGAVSLNRDHDIVVLYEALNQGILPAASFFK